MNLYQEIILLKHFFAGKFVVENVVSYYEPLIKPYRVERHFFWSNFVIPARPYSRDACVTNARGSTRRSSDVFLKELEKLHGFDLSMFDVSKQFKSKLLANCVRPELGLYVFNCAYKDKQSTL
jgi:DNA (cytosine-5)-methyltransferase 1